MQGQWLSSLLDLVQRAVIRIGQSNVGHLGVLRFLDSRCGIQPKENAHEYSAARVPERHTDRPSIAQPSGSSDNPYCHGFFLQSCADYHTISLRLSCVVYMDSDFDYEQVHWSLICIEAAAGGKDQWCKWLLADNCSVHGDIRCCAGRTFRSISTSSLSQHRRRQCIKLIRMYSNSGSEAGYMIPISSLSKLIFSHSPLQQHEHHGRR